MTSPVPGVGISTPYGKRGSHWSCNEDSSGNGVHTGVDFACAAGTNIVAPIAGQVRHRSYGSAFGSHQFAISPDPGQPFADGEVFFAHTKTRPGDGVYVNIGDYLAEVGAEGNVTGAHLHFEYHPTSKGSWSCAVHANPQPVLDHQSGAPSGGEGDWASGDVWVEKLHYGQMDSDSVKRLQHQLNQTSLEGGQELPITGNYLDETDEEVRLWQVQVCGDPADPVNQSFLGPSQAAKMFPSPPYVLH